jgi:hypothetical protein
MFADNGQPRRNLICKKSTSCHVFEMDAIRTLLARSEGGETQ